MDQFRDVVFQEFLAVGLEVGDDGSAVGRVRARETEVQRIAAAALERLQAELAGPILIVREGLGIDHLQVNLAARARRDLFEELPDPASHRA